MDFSLRTKQWWVYIKIIRMSMINLIEIRLMSLIFWVCHVLCVTEHQEINWTPCIQFAFSVFKLFALGSILAQPRNALGTKLFELTNQLANLGVPSEHVIFGGDEILCEYDASTVIWAKLYDYSFIICVYYVYKLYIFEKNMYLRGFQRPSKYYLSFGFVLFWGLWKSHSCM